ncbi:MAG: hypothetical protein CFE23_08435 [Flavobacterium sp. BFFFF1]|uniref:hypothetical protein n=1 Tax=Flavobacterium sp. BFFFF1 TaxID=2015557 RepID=UPI000BC6C265|nr:hypothetical protein [Flavobacterium sp. BFFFF1]OYU80507.1 MAG: hypothetical protein CFE23_08435 [Flavobacterium sp. BFFFF1]
MKTIIGILIVAVCIGCTSLRVNVSTANPIALKKIHDGIDQFEKLAFQYKRALQPLTGAKIIAEKDRIIMKHNEITEERIKAGRLIAKDAREKDSNFKRNYNAAVDTIFRKLDSANIHMVDKRYKNAVDIYLLIPERFQKMITILDKSNLLTEAEKEPVIREITIRLAEVNAVFHNGRANLLGDKMVSYISMKENSHIWKSTYNRTVSNTFFGNADIAVVLNEMPDSYNNNYSIKGVRVDAAKLIQATFDVMVQVVNVAASIAGMPSGGVANADSFYPDELTDVKDLPLKTSELANRKELFRESQRQLLLKILGENIDGKTLDQQQTSVADIKAFWEMYKANLD